MTVRDLGLGSSWLRRVHRWLGLGPRDVAVLVVVSEDGRHSVEVYSSREDADARKQEYLESGFLGRNISIASRFILYGIDPKRHYGPAWKKATGWTR